MTLESFLDNTVAGNLGLAWPDLLIIIILLVCLIFFAVSLRIGLVTSFVSMAFTYIAFAQWGLPTIHAFTIFIGIGVIMIGTIFISSSRQGSGAIGI